MSNPPVTEVKALIVEDPKLPGDKTIFDGMDVSRQPWFTVSEVAKFFFAKSPHWVRWRERKGYFVLGHPECPHTQVVKVPYTSDGKTEITRDRAAELPAGEVKWVDKTVLATEDGHCVLCGGTEVANKRTPEGARYYDLADVENMAYALADKEGITGGELHSVLQLLQVEARVWGYL